MPAIKLQTDVLREALKNSWQNLQHCVEFLEHGLDLPHMSVARKAKLRPFAP